MNQKAYNSSINGQISLNYRLALALERYSGESLVRESKAIFEQYKEKIFDYNNGPRKAGKPELLKRIIAPFMSKLKLRNTFFIAVTRDSPPNPMKNCPEEHLPLLLDKKGINYQIVGPDPEKPNLVSTFDSPTEGKRLILNGHIDVFRDHSPEHGRHPLHHRP